MKVVFVLLLVLLAFAACATLGYNIAADIGISPAGSLNASAPVDLNGGSQNNILVVVVDHIDQPQPNLMAVWFVSLYLMDGGQPTLTFAPVYTLYSTSPQAQTIRDQFSLNDQGEPAQAFWNTLKGLNIQWQGYVVADLFSAGRFVEWSGAYGDPPQALLTALANPIEGQTMAASLCQSISTAATRPEMDVNWPELVPNHLRTNLRLEAGLLFWQQMTHANPPVRCEILPPS